jgi:ribosomal protein S12 methylthiotransferase
VLSTPSWTAYVKIAEGCDNCCSYCVIPSLRGRLRSRPMESIIEEARALCEGGTKELIVVAQDISRYGLDLYGKRKLAELLRALCRIEGLSWIRLHYLNPDGFDEELISAIAEEDKILKYLDIPIQHISDRLLKSMNRRSTKAEIVELFKTLRARIPDLVLRTSLIAGFPGETEADFEELCDFLRKAKIERAGVFPYSAEEGTPAAGMPDQVPEDTKQRRVEIIMGIQQKVNDAYNRRMKGRTIDVLCEGYDRYASCYFGRSYADSPEIDGKVFFRSKEKIQEGGLIPVLITGKIGSDLHGNAAGHGA